MNNIVFVFVSFAVVLLSAFILMTLINSRAFTTTFTYTTTLEDARGLRKKPSIFFKGYEIGRISAFDLNERNEIEVEFYVYEEYQNKIIKYSVISKTTSPVSGEVTEFEILTPDLEEGQFKEVLAPNSQVPYINSALGRSYIRDGYIKGKTDDISGIIVKLNEILAGLVDNDVQNDGAIFQTLENLNGLTKNLEIVSRELIEKKTTSKMDETMQNVSLITNKLTTTIDYVNRTILQLDSTIFAYKNPNGLITKLGGTTFGNIMSNTDTTLVYIKQTLRSINESRYEINSIMYNLNKTLEQMDKTLQGINNNPLIRGGISDKTKTIGVEVNE